MKQVIVGFGILIFALLALFQLARLQSFRSGFQTEIWVAAFSILFFIIGVILSRNVFKPKTQVIEKEVFTNITEPFVADAAELARLGISKREFEILQLINEG